MAASADRQLLADASFVIGNRGGGVFDIPAVRWSAPLQYLAWTAGTALGAVGTGVIGDPDTFGLDVLFPVFYLSILLPEIRSDDEKGRAPGGRRPRLLVRPLVAAGLGVATALLLTPVAPPGVPVLAAAAAALIGLLPLRRSADGSAHE